LEPVIRTYLTQSTTHTHTSTTTIFNNNNIMSAMYYPPSSVAGSPSPATALPPQQAQTAQPQTQDANTLEKELENNPEDFSKWELYVSKREQEQNVPLIRLAYDKLLTEYPLLYGYWKKYADLEVSQSSGFSAVVSVYERGVNAIPYSVDLWMHYCVYVAEVSDDLKYIRSLFERAIEKIGDDYLAQILWDKYIEFEESQEEYANVFSLYTRVLYIPLKALDQYWDKLMRFASSRPTSVLLTGEELAQYESYGDEDARKRELINTRERIYQQTSVELKRRNEFEQGIERPYFHVQPLGVNELSTWRRYLENEADKCDEDRVVKLYERCLIACALYIEFWQRYAFYLESKNRFSDARKALNRAATIFLKRKPISQILWAEFEETQGNADIAKQIFRNSIEGVGKGHLETIVRFAQFYRRQNMHSEAIALFAEQRHNVQSNESKAFLSVQHANFVCDSHNDVEGGRSVLSQCVEEIPLSTYAWFAFIEYEVKNANKQDSESFTSTLQTIFERVVALSEDQLSGSDKISVLERYLSYMINYSTIQHIRTVEQSLLRLKTHASATSKKRKAEDSLDGPAKVAKTEADASASPATAAAYQQWYNNYYAQYYQQQYPQAGTPQPDGSAPYPTQATTAGGPDMYAQYAAPRPQ